MQTITSPPRRLPVGIAGLVARCGANLVSCLAAGLTIGWMVLLGLGSCAFTARGDVPEVWRTSIKLDGVSYRAGQLCWKRDVSSLDFSRIQRSPSTGGTVRAPYYNASAATRVWSRTAELDDSLNVYWASGGGKILSLGADATFTSALPTVLCAMETAGVLPPLVSVALNRVFWAERFGTFGNDAKIFFVQTAGGERTLVRDLAAVEGGVRQIAALTTPISPPSGPVTASFNGLHLKSNFFAVVTSKGGYRDYGPATGNAPGVSGHVSGPSKLQSCLLSVTFIVPRCDPAFAVPWMSFLNGHF